MGTDVHGNVEVHCVEITDLNHWSKIIDIGLIVERNYAIFGLLFGVRSKTSINGKAKNRGIPNRSSRPQDHENVDLHGQTWIYWEEIFEIHPELPKLRGWNLLFSTMELLYEQYGKESTRLVVSFDN